MVEIAELPTPAPGTGGLAGRREWTALAVLLLPLLLVSMDVSVLYFAVPFIARDLHPSATQQLWIFDVYGFVLAGLLMTMGALGDRIGRRRLLLIGAAAFSTASLAAAYAPSADALIAARAVLGIAGATLMPSTLALIRTLFTDERQRGRAIAIWTAVLSGGVALGPIISGVLLEHFWWGSVFLINLPAMALLLILGPRLLPEHRSLERAGRARSFDLVSAALSLGAVLAVTYGIKELAADGYAPGYVLAIAAGCALGALFARRQHTAQHPMVDRTLWRENAFRGGVACNVVAMFALVGNAVFMTQYLQSVLGMSPLRAAIWSVAPSLLVGAAAPVAAGLAGRFGRLAVIAGGFLVASAGFVVIALLPVRSGLVFALVGAALLAVGLVAVLTLVTDGAMAVIAPERAGAATAVLETGSEFGGALGIAVLGSIGAAIYRSRVAGSALTGLSPHARAQARGTLAGARDTAATLPAHAAHTLLDSAHAAFVDGIHGVGLCGAALLLLAAAGTAFAGNARRRFAISLTAGESRGVEQAG